MKFGFNKLVIVAAGLFLIGGCSESKKTQDAQSSSEATQSSKPSRDGSWHFKVGQRVTSKGPSKRVELQNKILTAESQCVVASSGKTSIYVSELDSKNPVVENNRVQRSASVIKIFIMIEAFRQIKAGQLTLNQQVIIPADDRVGGTSELANQNTHQLSVKQLLRLMIRNSDNTATNVLIDKLGGLAVINAEINRLGCSHTKLRRKMLDYWALQNGRDNVTSVSDLGKTLMALSGHRLLGHPYDSEMLQLLRYNSNQSKLPALINRKAVIYNKTGEFPDYGVQNDAAIVKKGKRAFVVVVLSENGTQQKQINAMQMLGKRLYSIFFS
ncbi:MAG: class A beta-lactamase-related serine hydrolase [Lentilactobacillus buchneri]|jgi:beta-lactamase class A|nr:class A beta-lactamase-related serine hydrolase [Lentilactobacillus buchneri]